MKDVWAFWIGMLARLVGVIAERYAGWLFGKIGDGAELGLDLLDDIGEFFHSMLQWAASQLCGRRTFGYDEEWRPGLHMR